LFPEVAERLGIRPVVAVAALLRTLRNAALRGGSATVVIGEDMARLVMRECGRVPSVIPNWALEEDATIDPTLRLEHPLRREWELDDAFIVGYSGNMGRAHNLAVLIEAAALLQDEPAIRFLLVGDGAQRATLEREAQRRRLAHVRFKPYQPRSALRATLTLPDIHVVSLDERLEGLIVPSKFVGAIALGKPVLWLGSRDGEIGRLVRETGAGVAIDGTEAPALAEAIRALASDPARMQTMRTNARSLWQARFRRADALTRWQELLEGIMCG
jgi:glycosyltransferase involved in cell wall biosynthesis